MVSLIASARCRNLPLPASTSAARRSNDYCHRLSGHAQQIHPHDGGIAFPGAICHRRQPNFVIILGEAQGWASMSEPLDDRNPDGSKSDFILTPNLDSIAQAGVRFSDFYAASPRCTPTRAALVTGRNPAALHMTFVNEGRQKMAV